MLWPSGDAPPHPCSGSGLPRGRARAAEWAQPEGEASPRQLGQQQGV
jgi:hypothetical protein